MKTLHGFTLHASRDGRRGGWRAGPGNRLPGPVQEVDRREPGGAQRVSVRRLPPLTGTHSAHSALSAAHARDVEAPAFGKAPAERKYECAVGAAPRERRLGVLRLHPRPNFWSG